MARNWPSKNHRPDTSKIPYKPRPGHPAIEAYLEREVKAGRLFGPFYSAEELHRDLMSAAQPGLKKKRGKN